jgi:beta-phosphoglucomutase-like phosphatase (HAD superfamily)
MKSQWKNLDRLILVDCDGVLLDWEWAFSVWMQERGYTQTPQAKQYYSISDQFNGVSKTEAKKFTKLFNESAAIGFLPALRDSVYYVKRLHEEYGYRFHCITSLSRDENAQKLREMNLNKIYGSTAFERIVCLDTGAHKDEALEEYEGTGCWWIEDKPENALAGWQAGLRPILLEHGHNMDYNHPDIHLAKNWKDIFYKITGNV